MRWGDALAEWMTRLLPLTAAALLIATATPAARAEDGCVACHADETQETAARRPALLFSKDAHRAAGLSCTACHGGVDGTMDYMEAHDETKGFRGKVAAAAVPDLCGGCHDDAARLKEAKARADLPVGQARQFRQSVHGRVHGVAGFEVPSCVSCHGAHGIRPAADPESPVHPTKVPETCARCHGDLATMRAFTTAQVRVDQWIEYKTSVHGRRLAEGDVKVAVCSSCHGSHDVLPATDPASSVHPTRVEETCGRCHADPARMAGYTVPAPGGGTRPLPTTQAADYRASVHREALVTKGDRSAPTCNVCHGNHGATPPDVRAVSHVCSRCHSREAELFDASPLRPELERRGFPACATCHGGHRILRPDDAFLAAVAEGRSASGWDPGERWRPVLRGFRETLARFERRAKDVEALVERVEDYGMDLTRARLDLGRARDGFLKARVAVHAFDPRRLDEVVTGTVDEEGGLPFLDRAEAGAREALDERTFRRVGLAVALAIIAILVVALRVKIRRLAAPR